MSNEKDEKEIDLFEEVKENSKSAAEIVEKAVNVQEALEKKTHTEMGMAEQFEIHKTLSTDAVDLGVMATAVVAAVVVNKASQYIDEKSEKITEIKDDISEKFAQVKETIKDKFTEKDAAKEWENDIAEKEKKLNDTHDKQLKALNDNNAMLVVQKMDLKKGPDAEKKLEQLKPIDQAMEEEYKNIEKKFKNGKDTLVKEKVALENAVIEASKYMNETKKQEVINGQREAFERQQELERKKEQERIR